MKKILITGGAGFIGSNLALTLINKGYTIRVLDNLSPQIHGNFPEQTSPLYQSIIGKTEFVYGTVTSKEDWIRAIEGQDAIIHLAAETGTGQSMYQIQHYCDVNIGGTAIMLDLLANTENTIRKIIITSSRAIYGEGKYECKDHGTVFPESRNDKDMQIGDFECKCPNCNQSVKLLPTTEDSRINPSSIYGITKQSQEQMVLTIGKALRIPAVAFRYQNVYGPGQSLSNPYTGILSIFSNLLLNGRNINVFEDGKESRDFVYIDDVVAATILGLENDYANFEVFNVGADKAIDVHTIAEFLRSVYNSSSEITITGNYRIGDIRHNFADISKAKKLLGYEPAVNFDMGIHKFIEWVKTTPKNDIDNYENSLHEMKIKGLFK
jgi:dTDP-L-rhamnose 4-epimerase